MKRTPAETALLAALLFKRAGQNRARLSESTIRVLSGRAHLRTVFLESLRSELDDLGFVFIEISRGYALLPLSALNGAPAITAKKHLSDVLSGIKKGHEIKFTAIADELDLDDDESSAEDE